MAKRIVTKRGFVYSANIDGKYKRYFQYVCKDLTDLNSEVIRVFKTLYPLDAKPNLEEVVNDEVFFHIHTFLKLGLWDEVWVKEGYQPVNDFPTYQIYFGQIGIVKPGINILTYRKNLPKDWKVWKVGEEWMTFEEIPSSLYDKLEIGSVFPYQWILYRMKYGFFKETLPLYAVIPRVPLPDVDIYLRREIDGTVTYYHFKGDKAVQEVIEVDGKVIRLSEANPAENGYELMKSKFGETYWIFNDFITEEEFLAAWNQAHDTIHSDIKDSHHADVKDTNHTDIKDEIMKEEVFQSDANNDSDNVEYIMRNDYLSVFPNGAGEMTVYFDIESEVPYEIGNQMEEIDDRAYMNGCGWEGLLNFVIKTRHPELADTFETDCEGGTYVALFPDDAEGIKNARKLGEIIVSLIDNKEELFRIVREHADDICWDELDCED